MVHRGLACVLRLLKLLNMEVDPSCALCHPSMRPARPARWQVEKVHGSNSQQRSHCSRPSCAIVVHGELRPPDSDDRDYHASSIFVTAALGSIYEYLWCVHRFSVLNACVAN